MDGVNVHLVRQVFGLVVIDNLQDIQLGVWNLTRCLQLVARRFTELQTHQLTHRFLDGDWISIEYVFCQRCNELFQRILTVFQLLFFACARSQTE